VVCYGRGPLSAHQIIRRDRPWGLKMPHNRRSVLCMRPPDLGSFRTYPIYPAGEVHALESGPSHIGGENGREPALDSLSAQNSLPRGGTHA
jgi:hypothetical protein